MFSALLSAYLQQNKLAPWPISVFSSYFICLNLGLNGNINRRYKQSRLIYKIGYLEIVIVMTITLNLIAI